MGIIKSLENRRTYYNIDKNLPVLEKEIEEKIKEVTELVPDAFNMKSARIVLAFGENTIGCGMKFTMFLREKYLGKK